MKQRCQVAKELTEVDALGTHIRDELGINEISKANPIQAALASGAAFTIGGVLPLLVILFAPVKELEYWLYGFTIIFLIILGATSGKNRRFKNLKSNPTDYHLGYNCYGIICVCGLSFWS